MGKGTKSKVIGVFIVVFIVAATIVGLLGANDLIWGSSKLDLNYPRNDFHYELGGKPTQDLPIIKITSEENFRKIQGHNQQDCYVEYETNYQYLLGIKFSSVSIKFWTVNDDCIFWMEKTQNLPLFRQIKNVELDLGSDDDLKPENIDLESNEMRLRIR